MSQPFAAETWARRSTTPAMLLNGVYSGIVGGPIHAVLDASSRTVQVFSISCHHFQGFANEACISFDDGATWAMTFNEAGDPGLNVQCITGWSMPHPSIPGDRIHFQVRVAWQKSFFIASGDMAPGGIELWFSEGTASFSKMQDLHSWPAINAIPENTGGAAGFDVTPSVTNPILLEGSGPDGEDAWWFISSYDIVAGGASNRTHFKAASLWRSVDGGITWENVRDMEPVTGMASYASLVQSTSGRLVVVQGGTGGIFWTDGDLLTGTFTAAVFNGASGVRGPLMEMYGGTFFTFSQGTLTGPGSGWVSCDDCENFNGTAALIPQNRGGFGVKLGPTELLVVAPGFADPTTQTCAYYSSNGGEDFIASQPWLVSGTGEMPVNIDIRTNGSPIVVCRGGGVFISSDKVRGVFSPRTVCPLANAGLAAARPLLLCGAPLTPVCKD